MLEILINYRNGFYRFPKPYTFLNSLVLKTIGMDEYPPSTL